VGIVCASVILYHTDAYIGLMLYLILQIMYPIFAVVGFIFKFNNYQYV